MFVKLFLNIFLVKVLNTIVYRTLQSMYTNNPHNYIYVQTDELSYTSFVNVVKYVCIISSVKYM